MSVEQKTIAPDVKEWRNQVQRKASMLMVAIASRGTSSDLEKAERHIRYALDSCDRHMERTS